MITDALVFTNIYIYMSLHIIIHVYVYNFQIASVFSSSSAALCLDPSW